MGVARARLCEKVTFKYPVTLAASHKPKVPHTSGPPGLVTSWLYPHVSAGRRFSLMDPNACLSSVSLVAFQREICLSLQLLTCEGFRIRACGVITFRSEKTFYSSKYSILLLGYREKVCKKAKCLAPDLEYNCGNQCSPCSRRLGHSRIHNLRFSSKHICRASTDTMAV